MVAGFAVILVSSMLSVPSSDANSRQSIPATEALSLDKLSSLGWAELDCLYRQAQSGRSPCGVLEGRVIYDNQRKLFKAKTAGAKAMWLGKEFDPEQEMLINRWRFGRAVKAAVYPGTSWLDGQPALISDYRETSPLIWRNVRDEIREVAPGLYLGAMFRCESSGARFAVFFALQECQR